MRWTWCALGCLAIAPFAVVGCGSRGGEGTGASREAVTAPVCGAASTGPVQGVDVSEYQGAFDWAAAKAKGTVFGYARISDGTGHVDATFSGNWSRMKAAGVYRGAYQFFEPGEDATTQANMMVSAVGALGDGDLPCMIDVEVTGGQSGATIASKVKTWMDVVQAGTGKAPIIYTGSYFWEDNVGAAIATTPIWIAAYGPTCPALPAGWGDWLIWQYSDGSGTLDHDVFNGTLADLQKLAGAGAGAAAASWPMLARRSLVDVDGDARADVCARSAAGLVCDLASGAGFGGELAGPAWSDAAGWTKPEYFATIQFGDVTGDGKTDVCARSAAGVVCEPSLGASFGAEIAGPAWSDAAGWAKPQYYATIQLGDVNGDGKADVCGRSAAGVACAISDGATFGTTIAGPAWSDASGWDQPQFYGSIQLADVNGDGMDDVCGRSAAGIVCELADGHGFPTEITGPAWSDASGWGAVEYGSTIRFADVNGDGKSDVCGRAKDGVHCALSDGHGFPTAVAGPAWSDAGGWNAAKHYETIRFADVNGDGKSDVCARGYSSMLCELSDGSAFPTEVKGPAWGDAAGWSAPEYYETIGAGDVDGDGMDDLCARAASGIVCAMANGGGFAPAIDGPSWSDTSGWTTAEHYATIRVLGAPHKAGATPPPSTADAGATPSPPAGSGAVAGSASASVDASTSGSGGCAVTRARSETDALAWIAVSLAAALAARRRRAAR